MSHLQHHPLDLASLLAAIVSPDRGAVATFSGLVRNHHAGREVSGLSYSAYEPMAEQVCQEIVAEAEHRFPVRVGLVHRLGEVPIGESAVLVAVAAAHRAAAFDAVRWVIDAVKVRVPIWKRERYADGSEAWVDPTAENGIVPARGNA